MHELPLVFFTVLAQSAAGIALFATIGLLVGQVDTEKFRNGMLCALVTIGIGGIASLFHLGHPLRAMNALAGIGRSPMSNEIITTILFGASVATAAFMALKGKAKSMLMGLGVLSSALGVALLFVIPSIYTIETVPQWDTPFTSAQMVLTGLAVGAVVIHLLQPERIFALAAMAFLVVGVAIMPMYFTFLGGAAPELIQQDVTFWTLKAVFAGVAIIAVASSKVNHGMLSSTAMVAVLVSEFCGRIGFFDLWQIGM